MLRNGEQIARQPERGPAWGTPQTPRVLGIARETPTEDIQVREADRRREQTRTPVGERGGGGMNWDAGSDIFTLPCIKYVTNGKLLS